MGLKNPYTILFTLIQQHHRNIAGKSVLDPYSKGLCKIEHQSHASKEDSATQQTWTQQIKIKIKTKVKSKSHTLAC